MRNVTSAMLLVLAVGCGAHAERDEAPRGTGYLVLISEGTALRTEWRDEDGALRGRADGALLGVGDRLYRFESRPERIGLRTCGEIVRDADTDAPVASSGIVASAMLSGIGGASVVLVGPAADGAVQDYAELDESHTVLAALGDRVVVVSRRAGHACGAHPNVEVTVRTYDLGSGAEVIEPVGERDALRARGPEALAALRALEPDRAVACLSEAAPSAERRATVPAFTDGMLGSRHLFAVAVPGACGTLEAPTSAYEWGIWLDGPAGELPPSYRERAIPDGVLRHAAGAIGITWLSTARAPMGDAFALASD